jgi:hypothetical protein
MTPSPSLCVPRSAIAKISHDERALDATLRERFTYLLRIARVLGDESPTIMDAVAERRALIAYEFRCRLGSRP